MIAKRIPSLSVVIPVYNEERNLKRLLPSLEKQDYPRNKIEYVVVDDGSTDGSSRLVREFGCRVIKVNTHDIELNKGIGMHAARNELVYWLDADMEVCSKDFFKLLVRPLMEDKRIVGSFTREFALDAGGPVKSSLLRFISYHPLQQDPLYAHFSPAVEGTIVETREDYLVCKFNPGKIPAVGRIVYRRRELLGTLVGKDKAFIDMESVEIVARAGYRLFAYVPKAKIRHYHAETLRGLVRKRLRNLERDYLPNYEHKYFLWFNPKDKRDVLKIIFWVIWANLFFPELVRGVLRSVFHKDVAFLWHPVVAIAATDAVLWGFLSRKKGRKLAFDLIKSLFVSR